MEVEPKPHNITIEFPDDTIAPGFIVCVEKKPKPDLKEILKVKEDEGIPSEKVCSGCNGSG